MIKKRSYTISHNERREQQLNDAKRKRTVSASATFFEEESLVVPQVSLEQLAVEPERIPEEVVPGSPVNDKCLRRVGPYVLGQQLGNSPVKSIVQCLARIPESGRDDYFAIKILTLPDDVSDETQDERQGRMLIHTEYSLLSLLSDMDGVIHCHGLFKDEAFEEKEVMQFSC